MLNKIICLSVCHGGTVSAVIIEHQKLVWKILLYSVGDCNPLWSNPMVLKLCVATPWCVVVIFQGRRTKVNSAQFYSMS